ncbi:MAG: sel1 repeat family protein [Bacteroidales bacterium]|nr:sel1 repeat family protein [Bacteroidales bacterium]
MKTKLLILLLVIATNFACSQSFVEIKKSAEQGYAEAQFNLGIMYNYGLGTEKELKQVFYWNKKKLSKGKQ